MWAAVSRGALTPRSTPAANWCARASSTPTCTRATVRRIASSPTRVGPSSSASRFWTSACRVRAHGWVAIPATLARPTPTQKAETRLLATFTIAEMLRNGITTFMEFGSQLRVQEALLGEVERLGLRAYLGAGYDSGRWVGDERGRLKRVVDEAAGVKEFESAMAFVRRVDGSVNGRVRGLLAPREVETCSLDLLRATRKAAEELRLPIVTHAAYNIIEFYEIVREHRMTPVELMEQVGLLGPDLTVGHGNLVADNGLMSYAGGHD